jgi:hypothetical protein
VRDALNGLAARIADQKTPTGAVLRLMTVTAVGSGTVDLALGDGTAYAAGVPVVGALPSVGATVSVLAQQADPGIVLGQPGAGGNYRAAQTTVTLDSSGLATIAHGLGVTPASVCVTGHAPASGTPSIPAQIIADSFNATTFRVRVWGPGGSSALTGVTVVLNWIAAS